MFLFKFNLFSSATNLTLKSKFALYIFSLYELVPIILLCIEWIAGEVNYLNVILKYISAHYHLELINLALSTGGVSFDWKLNNANITQALPGQVLSQTYPFIRSEKIIYLTNLALNIGLSKISPLLFIIIAALLYLTVGFGIVVSCSNIFRTKMSKSMSSLISFFTNFSYMVLRPLSQILYIVFFNCIICYLRFSALGTVESNDLIFFFVSIVSIIILTLILLLTTRNLRFYSTDYYYDPKSKVFDYFLIFLKMIVGLDIALRKYFMTEKILFVFILLKITVIAAFIYEYNYNEYVNNLNFNNFRLGVIIFSFCLCVFCIINQIFSITSVSTIIIEYVLFLSLSFYMVYSNYSNYFSLDFLANTGDMLVNENFGKFFRNALRYVLQYKDKRQMLKGKINAEDLENDLIKENLNSLNSHYWNCKMKISGKKRCPICKIHKTFILDKVATSPDMNKSLLNEHLIILSIFKFICMLEKKVYTMAKPLESDLEIVVDNKTITPYDMIKDFEISDFFFLKYTLISILDVNLNRLVLCCTLYGNKYKDSENVQLYSRYLKLHMKALNSEVFKDYKVLKIEDTIIKDYNILLKLYQSFLDDVSIKKVNYSELLGRYLDFGVINNTVRKKLEKLSKSVQMENSLNFIMLISIYKYVFNNTYDKYLSQMYELNENIKMFESRYSKDNVLVMDFNLHSNKMILKKIPTKQSLKGIFNTSDLERDLDDFFPSVIRSNESKKLIESCVKNKTNTATLSTYFVDKEFFIHRVNLKIKIFLTIEKNFKIYASVDFERNKNCFIVDKNGRINTLSRDFYNNFYIHPKVVLKYPSLNIYQFIHEMVQNESNGEVKTDLSNQKTIIVNLNMRNYKRNYFRTMKPFENISSELLYGKIGTEDEFNRELEAEEGQGPMGTFVKDAEDRMLLMNVFFKQIEKIKIEADPGLVVIFSYKMKSSRGKNKNLLEDEMEKLDISTNSDGDDDETPEGEENLSQFNFENDASVAHSVDNASVASVSTDNSKSDETTLKVFNRDAKKFTKYKKNSKDMTRFCYYIVIINVFILIIGVVFLILVQNNLNFFKAVYAAFQNFMLESWDIYMNILGISTFYTINDSKSQFSLNDFGVYKMNSTNNKNITIDFSTYLMQDLNVKLNTLNAQISATHPNMITTLSQSYVDANINIPTEMFGFSFIEKSYSLTPINFFNDLQTFQSLLYSLAGQTRYIGLDSINMSNNASFVPLVSQFFITNSTGTEYEKNSILLIINYYKNLHTKIANIIFNFEEYLYQLVSSSNNILIFGFVILLIMDVAIIYFTFMLLTIYKMQVKLVMTLIYSIEMEFVTELTIKIKYINEFLNNLNSPLKSTEQLKVLALKSRENNKKIIDKLAQAQLSDEELDLKKREESDKIKFISDEGEILQKYYSILMILMLIMTAYFSYGFTVFSSKIARMYIRLNLTKYFFAYLTFPVDNFIQLKYAMIMNKTNIEDDYFTQKIETESFMNRYTNVDEAINYVKVYYFQNKDTLPYLTILFKEMSPDKICPFMQGINDKMYDGNYVTAAKQDVSATYLYLCQSYPVFDTDFFTIIETLKMSIREIYYDYVDSDRSNDAIKAVLDSSKMNDLNIMISILLKPLCDYILKEILTPCFNRDISILLTNCIIILVANIIMSIFFLFITQKYILKKTIESVENLNTLIKILN